MNEQIEKATGRKSTFISRIWFVPLLMLLAVSSIGYGGDEYRHPRGIYYPHNLIRTLQEALHQQGLDPGKIDGLMGPKTEAAITEFQRREKSLEKTGKPDANTVAHLLKRNRQAIRQLQQHLASEGYDCPVDGELGPETKAALRKYDNDKEIERSLAEKLRYEPMPVEFFDPPPPVAESPDVEDAIHQLQQWLASKGFSDSPVDGELRPAPVEVVDPPQ